MKIIYTSLLFLLLFISCQKETKKQFSLLSSKETGILFSNNIQETDSLNYFIYPYMYMGGGVSAGDINNDGLIDLFFTANQESNKLYLNKGSFQFEDITEIAKLKGDNRWFTGTTMVDINNDGFLDIYVSVSGKNEERKNLLYINNGDLTFTEKAKEYGINNNGHTTQSTFFDYDNDGDLDLYLANYPPTKFSSPVEYYAYKMQHPILEDSDILYKNNNDGTFTDVTTESGILNFGLSLSATSGDFNNDGWQDIYVSNDFDSPDYFYLNNQDGTFSEVSKTVLNHTSQYGMGADIADYNNDNLLDLAQVDMTPEDNRRLKANMASMNPAGFSNMVSNGLHHQYMQNSLQLNQGIDSDGNLKFSEISRISGLSTTDWSWSILFSDLDNDGWKDIMISNGTRRDINNKDYFKKLKVKRHFDKSLLAEDVMKIPSEKTSNYIYKNNSDYTFANVTKEWGITNKTFSNGAVYADLNNDGNLDMIVNNIDEEASIYRNNNPSNNNFIKIILNGTSKNKNGLGSRVSITTPSGTQMQELTLTRGFQSSVAPEIHFGIEKQDTISSIKVVWVDGNTSEHKNVKANQTLVLNYSDSRKNTFQTTTANNLFTSILSDSLNSSFKHQENFYSDYDKEPLLPHQTSMLGPGLAVADVNGDGLEDFYIGGATNQRGALYIQNSNGKFGTANESVWEQDKASEDMSAIFFDFDADGDKDLYVVSGGNEFNINSPELQDRLYINDNGTFTKGEEVLPTMLTSGSRVKPADFDNDGDLDLFIGGRLIPGQYPWPAKSYILKNNNGIYEDVTQQLIPEFESIGMVTDAIWTDFNGDNSLDLILTGEWMPVSFFANEKDSFKNVTSSTELQDTTGWWFSLEQGDFDNDGDQDFIAGNLGLNYKYQASADEPFEVHADDFDDNGRKDIVLSYYNFGTLFPLRGRQCSSQQIASITTKFESYDSFANADLTDVYGENELENAEIHYQAKTFASSYIENLGDGKFSISQLPNETQFSSINKILSEDFDGDGNKDLLLAGNLYSSEIETPRNDASYGQFLKGNGKGDFDVIPSATSGLYLPGDVKDMVTITIGSSNYIIVAKNNDAIQFVKLNF